MSEQEMNAGARAAPGGNEAATSERTSVVRHEEELGVTAVTGEGAVRARKHVADEHVDELVPRSVEHLDQIERLAPNAEDSGEVEILPDGSVSIPILEEELVIEKRTVVRERVVIRKRTETRHERVEAVLRKERVAVEGDIEDRVDERR